MKKLFSLVLLGLVSSVVLVGCGAKDTPTSTAPAPASTNTVSTNK